MQDNEEYNYPQEMMDGEEWQRLCRQRDIEMMRHLRLADIFGWLPPPVDITRMPSDIAEQEWTVSHSLE